MKGGGGNNKMISYYFLDKKIWFSQNQSTYCVTLKVTSPHHLISKPNNSSSIKVCQYISQEENINWEYITEVYWGTLSLIHCTLYDIFIFCPSTFCLLVSQAWRALKDHAKENHNIHFFVHFSDYSPLGEIADEFSIEIGTEKV